MEIIAVLCFTSLNKKNSVLDARPLSFPEIPSSIDVKLSFVKLPKESGALLLLRNERVSLGDTARTLAGPGKVALPSERLSQMLVGTPKS